MQNVIELDFGASPRLGGGPLRVTRRILGPESQLRDVKTAVSSCQHLKARGWQLQELAECGFTTDEIKVAFGPLSPQMFLKVKEMTLSKTAAAESPIKERYLVKDLLEAGFNSQRFEERTQPIKLIAAGHSRLDMRRLGYPRQPPEIKRCLLQNR